MESAAATFVQAQKLFNAFQKNWRYPELEKCLLILDDIISGSGPDLKRANNLKHTIEIYIANQVKRIFKKYNFAEFNSNGYTLLGSLDHNDALALFAIYRYLEYLDP